jgi:hypothetical protein
MPAQPPLSPPVPTLVGDAAADVPAGAPRPPSERHLNSPTPLTLRLLGVIFLATFIPWVAAKAACNLREAPVRSPVDLPTDVFAKQPKSAALELQQRAATGRYREAAELAKGAAKDELLAADARCAAEPAPCEALRAGQARVVSRAVLVSRTPVAAEVRAESSSGDTAERFTLRLEAEGGRWYVTSREPFSGALTEPAAPAAEPTGTASSAPGTSAPGHP